MFKQNLPGSMKVLMFGWEFPPRISGGLGTACFGLTQSLIKQKVKVLFVVPTLFGDETDKNAFLINASAVSNGEEEKGEYSIERTSNVRRHALKRPSVVTSRSGMTYIEVPAGLSPYEPPAIRQHSDRREKSIVRNDSTAYHDV